MFPKEPSSPTCLACYKPLPLPVEPAVPIARCCSCDQVLSPERVQNNHKTCDRSCAGKYANSIKKMQAVALEATAAEIQSPETRPTEPAIQPTQPTSEPDENKMNKSVKTVYYAVYVKDGTSEQVHRAFRREDTAQLCLYGLRKEGKGAVIRKMEQLEISEETASEFLANELKAMS